MLFAVAMVHLDGPARLRDAQDVRCRPRPGRAPNRLRVLVPRGPWADEDTDGTRPLGEPPLEWSHQGRALSSVWSGQRHALIPLVSARWGPWGALLVVQRPLGRARTHHLPALTAAAFAHARGRIPTVTEPGALATRGQPRWSRRPPRLGQRGCLAQVQPLRRVPLALETPPGLLAAGEPPSIRLGPGATFEADLHMHGAMGVVGLLFAWALGVLRMVCAGFEMSGALVFCVSRVIQAHREGPMVPLLGRGHPVCHETGTEWRPPVRSRPRTAAPRVRPMRGGGSLDHAARQTGEGCVPYFGDHPRIGQASHLRPWWLVPRQVHTTQKGQPCGRMLYHELEHGDSLAVVRFGWHS